MLTRDSAPGSQKACRLITGAVPSHTPALTWVFHSWPSAHWLARKVSAASRPGFVLGVSVVTEALRQLWAGCAPSPSRCSEESGEMPENETVAQVTEMKSQQWSGLKAHVT